MATVTPFSPETSPLNLTEYCLGRPAGKQPDAIALIIDGAEQYSFAELEQKVLCAAAALAEIPAGSRVLIALPDSFEFVLAFFAANAAGLVPIPASSQLTVRELTAMATIAVAVIGDTNTPALGKPVIAVEHLIHSDIAADYADTDAESPAYVLFTSGTTSQPKAVVHPQRTISGRQPMHQQWLGLKAGDRLLHAGALNWSYTLGVGLMDPWCNGATAIVCPGGREPSEWPAIIERHQATIFAAVPGVYRRLLKYSASAVANQLASLRHAVTAGEALSPALLQNWQNATGKPLYEALGMTECSTYISGGPGIPTQPGSPGKPQTGRIISVLDEVTGEPLDVNEPGLLAIHRSERGLMSGYLQLSPASWRGDWFITGDRVRQDEDGYIHHLGRNSDVMNAQGYRVSPQEVEAVLSDCAGVVELAVAETLVDSDLSLIVAYVVADDDFSTHALLELATRQLAAYKRPRAVQLIDALPRTRNGKLRRAALPAMYKQVRGSMTKPDTAV